MDQSDTAFQGTFAGGGIYGTSTEHIGNDFWGIGPKLGVENALNLWCAGQCKADLVMNFYAAYLLGFWSIRDSATNTSNQAVSTQIVPIDSRDFGALAFQTMIGLHLDYGNWDATVGCEFNDWLNQCQIFDYATGPHNNDLIVQGASMRVSYSF